MTTSVKLKDNSLFNLGMGETILKVNLLEGPNNLKITLTEIGMIQGGDGYAKTTVHQTKTKDDVIKIGRSYSCNIQVNDEHISKLQATIMYNKKMRHWELEDGHYGN